MGLKIQFQVVRDLGYERQEGGVTKNFVEAPCRWLGIAPK